MDGLTDENQKMQKELKQIWSRIETAGSSCLKRAKITPVAPPLPIFCRSLSLSFEPECVRAFAPEASERASEQPVFICHHRAAQNISKGLTEIGGGRGGGGGGGGAAAIKDRPAAERASRVMNECTERGPLCDARLVVRRDARASAMPVIYLHCPSRPNLPSSDA